MSQLSIITFALITEINDNTTYLVFLQSCVCLPLIWNIFFCVAVFTSPLVCVQPSNSDRQQTLDVLPSRLHAALYVGGNQEPTCSSMISPSKSKGPAAIWEHLSPVVDNLQATHPEVSVMHSGQSINFTLSFFSKAVFVLEVCLGSFSCWNTALTVPSMNCSWQHYFPKTTSGYDAEHVHSTSLVDHGKACSERNLSC